jgi:hypothetical protein
MMGRSLAVFAVAGCTFRPGAAPQDGMHDAAADTRDAAHDAAHDTGKDAGSCTPIATGSAAISVPAVVTPPSIDGNLDDWNTCFIELDGSNAQNIAGAPPFASGRFALEYGSDTLYLAAEVVGVAPLGSAGLPDIFVNNAVEIYVDGDGLASAAAYDAHTAQLVVDHNNAQKWFVTGQAMNLPQVATAVTLGSDGVTYRVEIAVPATALGLVQLASPFGFDIDWTTGSGATQLSRIAWAQTCPSCTKDPCCDAREFGTATLAP